MAVASGNSSKSGVFGASATPSKTALIHDLRDDLWAWWGGAHALRCSPEIPCVVSRCRWSASALLANYDYRVTKNGGPPTLRALYAEAGKRPFYMAIPKPRDMVAALREEIHKNWAAMHYYRCRPAEPCNRRGGCLWPAPTETNP